jgi:hypothetical protein
MNRNTISLQERVKNAAQILKVEESEIEKALSEGLGIEYDDVDAVELMDAESTTEAMISGALQTHVKGYKVARGAAAVAWLKGRDPFAKDEEDKGDKPCLTFADPVGTASLTTTVTKIIDATKPIHQHKDRELLQRYVDERDYEMEQELHKRAKTQPFIVLMDNEKHEPGKEPIDIECSLDLLRRARKGYAVNSIIPYGETVANVYRITDLNRDDRKVELCPICGDTLFKGYCEGCGLNWTPVGKDERAYAYLIAEHSGRFQKDSFSDRKALHASAATGLADLRKTWPSMAKLFDDRKEIDDLPKLILLQNRPSMAHADPFHVSGNRTY